MKLKFQNKIRENLPRAIAAFIAVVVLTSLAGVPFGYELPPLSTRQDVTYEKDILPIFKDNCLPCHGPAKQKRRLRLDTLEQILKGCEDGPVIFPGKTDQGDLILEICGLGDHDMPPYPSPPPIFSRSRETNAPASRSKQPQPRPLTRAEIGLVRAWVAQGAK